MKKLIIHGKIVELLSVIPPADAGELIKALIAYNEHGILNITDESIRKSVESILDHAEKISKIRSMVGKKGADRIHLPSNLPSKSFAKQFAKQNDDFAKQMDILPSNLPSKMENDEKNNPTIYNINNNINKINKEEINKEEKKNKKKIAKEEKQKSFEKRKQAFYDSLIQYVDEFGAKLVREFFDYWTEPNKSQTKMRWEMEKTWSTKLRISKWRRIDDKNDNNGKNTRHNTTIAERCIASGMQAIANRRARGTIDADALLSSAEGLFSRDGDNLGAEF